MVETYAYGQSLGSFFADIVTEVLYMVLSSGLSQNYSHLTICHARPVEMKDVATPNRVNITGRGGDPPCTSISQDLAGRLEMLLMHMGLSVHQSTYSLEVPLLRQPYRQNFAVSVTYQRNQKAAVNPSH